MLATLKTKTINDSSTKHSHLNNIPLGLNYRSVKFKTKKKAKKTCFIFSDLNYLNKNKIMADKDKPKIDLGLLEEDDEFEEFPAEGN